MLIVDPSNENVRQQLEMPLMLETSLNAAPDTPCNEETTSMISALLEMINSNCRAIGAEMELNSTQQYIGLRSKDHGNAVNLASFRPAKNWLKLEVRHSRTGEIDEALESRRLGGAHYDGVHHVDGRYRVRLSNDDIRTHNAFLRDLLGQALRQ